MIYLISYLTLHAVGVALMIYILWKHLPFNGWEWCRVVFFLAIPWIIFLLIGADYLETYIESRERKQP